MLVSQAKRTVWLGTADIKDLYVDDKPFLALLASLLRKGVEVRLIHAKEPGTAWREDHERHPILYDGMERVLCPRVHLAIAYVRRDSAISEQARMALAAPSVQTHHHRQYHCLRRLRQPDGSRNGDEVVKEAEFRGRHPDR